jgi:pyrimidine deaminase RibD-like protein
MLLVHVGASIAASEYTLAFVGAYYVSQEPCQKYLRDTCFFSLLLGKAVAGRIFHARKWMNNFVYSSGLIIKLDNISI